MVTLLPRNSPTPMAPPIAIMVSCLWLRPRCRPSTCGDECASTELPVASGSVMTGSDRGNHEIEVLRQNLCYRFYVIHCVVHMEGDSQSVIAIRGDDSFCRQLPHQ